MIVVSAFEPPAVVAGLDNVAVMGQSVEQRGGHLGVAEHVGPFAEGDDGGALIEPADEMGEKLAAGLGEGQIAEFIQHDEVHPGQMLGEPSLPSVAGLGLEPLDEVDYVEAAAGTGSDAASGDGNGQVGFAWHYVALLGDEAAAGEVIDQRSVDRRVVELEVIGVLGKRQVGNGELVLDRAGLLLVDLGVELVADNALGFVLALDRGHLVEVGLHAVELEFAHEVKDLGSFHQLVLWRLS